jgi:hypothetical protein
MNTHLLKKVIFGFTVASLPFAPQAALAKKKVPIKPPAKVAAKKNSGNVIAAGNPCPSLGSSMEMTHGKVVTKLECVTWQGKLQWWAPGTRQNPIKVGTVLPFVVEGENWEVSVLGRTEDDTDRTLAEGPSNELSTAGDIITGVQMQYRYIGPKPDSVISRATLSGYSRTRGPIDRWANGVAPAGDCWLNEGIDEGIERKCVMPYEIARAELATFRIAYTDYSTNKRWYFDTAPDQTPFE